MSMPLAYFKWIDRPMIWPDKAFDIIVLHLGMRKAHFIVEGDLAWALLAMPC